MSEGAMQFVDNARELPVMPPIAAEVMKKAENPDTDIKTISALISRDAALAVRVLKIANSSFYSMPRNVESIHQAVMLLGYSTLRTMVVAAAIKDVFARFGLAERLLWEHGIAGAVAGAQLADQIGGLAREEVFVGGLLHDIGKLVMHSQDEERYQEVMAAVYAEEKDSIQAERDVFGFDHAEVGKLVLRKWGLSEILSVAVGAHHDLELANDCDGAKPLAAVLQVADQLALREGIGRRKPSPELDPGAAKGAELLGLTEVDWEEFSADFVIAFEREKSVFG